MNKYKSRTVSYFILICYFSLIIGCNKPVSEIKEINNWKTKTLELVRNTRDENGGYFPIELLYNSPRNASLDQTWRFVEIYKLLGDNNINKKEIVASIKSCLTKEEVDVRDVVKIIAILEFIDPNNTLIGELKTWIKQNYHSGGWFSNNIYNIKNRKEGEPKDKTIDQLVKLDTLYFIITFSKEILGKAQIDEIQKNLVNSWNGLNYDFNASFTEKYLILTCLKELKYNISGLREVLKFRENVFNEYKKISINPYQDILKTSMIVELVKILDSNLIINENLLEKIADQQKGGFPLKENSNPSGIGSYAVVKMLSPNYFHKVDRKELVEYLNNNQSFETGFFYDDIIYKPNLLATAISILILNNLGSSDLVLKEDIAYLKNGLKEKIQTKNVRFVELFYTIKALEKTQYLTEEKVYLKEYILSNKLQIKDVKDLYYFVNIIESLGITLPAETETSIIDFSTNYLSKSIISDAKFYDLERMVYSIEIMQKYQKQINPQTQKQVLSIMRKAVTNKETTIIEYLFINEGLKILGDPEQAILKSDIPKYLGDNLNSRKFIPMIMLKPLISLGFGPIFT